MTRRIPALSAIVIACALALFTVTASLAGTGGMNGVSTKVLGADNPNQPTTTQKLVFIHHSCGQNWLEDGNGDLGTALMNDNYFVSDTNYGWGPDGIGDATDIGHWWSWFRGPNSATYTAALYTQYGQESWYSRLENDPGGENDIVMFKSCYPNSNLEGDPNAPVPAIENNPLRGQDCYSGNQTVANAKGIYLDLLEYFKTRQDKLFVAVTAPPVSSPAYAANARAFNNWLVNDWLDNYPYDNVFAFDFYNVLTSNGGGPNVNDLGWETGNHHRWWNNAVQHKTDDGGNTTAYSSGDDHPTAAGNKKGTGEFVQLLNVAYNNWSGGPEPVPEGPGFYFAEGTCRTGFDPYFCIQNPGETAAQVTVSYMKGDGSTVNQALTVPATSRSTVTVADFLGRGDGASYDFSAKVTCTNGQEIIAERPIYFIYKGLPGGHDVMGATAASSDLYFAEGTCRTGFDPYLCIQNPGETAAQVTITYMKGDGTEEEQAVTVGATSRETVKVADVLGRGDTEAFDFSARVRCSGEGEIIAERPIYFGYKNIWPGGHNVMGFEL